MNSPLSSTQSGSFQLAFDATPTSSSIDGVVGVSSGAAYNFTNLAAIVRFNPSGDIDARSGDNYVAAAPIPYSGGISYHFILNVNVPTHTYDAYVVVGGVQTAIGLNLAFRTEQAAVLSLSNIGSMASPGRETVCNITLSPQSSAPAVTPPTIATQPANQIITAGQTATFAVAAAGTAPMNYQWRMNKVNISGATSGRYSTMATTANTGSTFDVVVSNPAGTATSAAATLTVNPAAVAPAITMQPASQTKTAGQSATFTVAASGTSPMTYQWQRNNANIAGATSTSYTTAATTTADNGATFDVVVSNAAGTATSASATLTVNAAAVAPAITTQPASQTKTAGQTATFTVAASGTSPMTYQWQRNNANIGGATSASYTTAATTTADSGSAFDVVVSNSAGTATSSSATLTVNAAAIAPTITTQPASTSMMAGQSATFTVAASGTAPMTYQWQKNKVNIAGATSASYTTPATTSADNGSTFNAVVSNSVGSATSNAATLTVTTATLTLNASPASISFGSVNLSTTTTQTITLTNSGNSTVTISNVMISGPGFNASGGNGAILSAGQTTTISAIFDPSSAGSAVGSVTVTSNATNSPTTIALSGTGVAPVSHSVSLSWQPSTSPVNGYNVYSTTTPNGTFTKLTASPVAITDYVDGTVQAGQTYYYVVTAVGTDNVESIYSNQASALVP